MRKNAHKRQIIKFAAFKYISQAALVLSLAALASVIIFILIRGLPYINMQLLFGDYGREPSLKPALFGTFYLIIIALGVAAPIGIGSAIFLT